MKDSAIIGVGKFNFLTFVTKCGENMLATIKTKNQLTIPVEIMKQLGLTVGADVKVEAIGGSIVITPIIAIDKDFFDGKLATEIKEAYLEYQEDKKNGLIKTYSNVSDMIKDLRGDKNV